MSVLVSQNWWNGASVSENPAVARGPGRPLQHSEWKWRRRGLPRGALHGADPRATRQGDEPTLRLVCSDSPTDAIVARASTVSLPLCVEDANNCEPVINGVALPNARTLTALTGAGDILTWKQVRRRSASYTVVQVLTCFNWLN